MARKETRIRLDDLGKKARGEPTEHDLRRIQGGSYDMIIKIEGVEGESKVAGHDSPDHVAVLPAPPVEPLGTRARRR